MKEKSDIYGITYGCPKMNRNNNCPLLEIEHLTFKEKVDWINNLDYEKKESILSHHSFCTKTEVPKGLNEE
jgi:hypothetical protein